MKQIICSPEQLKQFAEFIDMGVRANGIVVAPAAMQLLAVLHAASDAPAAEPELDERK